MSETSEQPARRNKRSVRRDRITVVVGLIVVVLVPVLLMFGGPVALKLYDAGHRTIVTCSVSSAESAVGSSRSLRGVGTSTNQIYIDTKDCGELVLRWGVTAANRESITRELSSGGSFRFDIGEGSYRLRGLLGVVRQAVFVKDFDKVS
ncbi:hypothetical protein [Curtobacterium sp. PhB115]|uniref:hypothetical protein n=1 Tax=Curtobacterium sp. PhB115 TaxID=2485173 RepID=UPI000F4CA26E|nr:hypothetical protein [Curtobacterium sp. PhB115]ROP72228.1 hypothetical protein EDF19_1241 [Curtobacterium sp. PhB115]